MNKQAWQRPVPERTKPQRQFVSHVNLTGPRTSQKASHTMSGAERGAQMGYDVSEEQMKECCEHARFSDIPGAASDLFGAGFMGPMRPESFMALSERLMRDSLLWVVFVARSVQRQPPWANMGTGATSGTGASQPQVDSGGYVTEVASHQPVEITFQPQPGAESCALGVQELRAIDPACPGIGGIEISREANQWRVKVAIDETQPPGLYTGIVFDSKDGAIRGSLAIAVKSR